MSNPTASTVGVWPLEALVHQMLDTMLRLEQLAEFVIEIERRSFQIANYDALHAENLKLRNAATELERIRKSLDYVPGLAMTWMCSACAAIVWTPATPPGLTIFCKCGGVFRN